MQQIEVIQPILNRFKKDRTPKEFLELLQEASTATGSLATATSAELDLESSYDEAYSNSLEQLQPESSPQAYLQVLAIGLFVSHLVSRERSPAQTVNRLNVMGGCTGVAKLDEHEEGYIKYYWIPKLKKFPFSCHRHYQWLSVRRWLLEWAQEKELVRPEEKIGAGFIYGCLALSFSVLTIGSFLAVPLLSPEVESNIVEPRMIKIEGGELEMGCKPGREDGLECHSYEKRLDKITVPPFWLGDTEVTVGQYLACVDGGGCPEPVWREVGNKYHVQTGTFTLFKRLGVALTDENYPVVGVSWNDAQIYVKWLSDNSEHKYRLPTEAEWEYAARAGTDTTYPWGNTIGENKANCSGDDCGDTFPYASPVGSFVANPWGLKDMHGNVWEWVEHCLEPHRIIPMDNITNCSPDALRVVRGGSWDYGVWRMNSAMRYYGNTNSRSMDVGFRVARTN